MRLLLRVGSLLLLASLGSSALHAAQVTAFSPQGLVKNVQRVRATFSSPMVPLGDPLRLERPFEMDCRMEGEGRWIDSTTWIFEFSETLPAGVSCHFHLRENLTTLAGDRFAGATEFSFSTGGPAIVRTEPYEGSHSVAEDQIFVLQIDGPVDAESVEREAFFVVEGLASQIPVSIVSGENRSVILQNLYYFRDLPPDRVLLIQGRQHFPPGSEARLIWGPGIASPSGIRTESAQTLSFRTREEFSAQFSCRRTTADRDCVPLSSMAIRFSAPVPGSLANEIFLEGGGSIRRPEEEEDEWTSQFVFQGPFPPTTVFTLSLPEGIRDDAGRSLTNEGDFPLEVSTDDYPPLVKFPADFGILEAAASPVMPVTVRNVEAWLDLDLLEVRGPRLVEGSILKLPSDRLDHVFSWLKTVRGRTRAERDESVFDWTVVRPEEVRLPRPEGDQSFEVLGIPLPDPGFYVVELKSELLGEALLSPARPFYVTSSALVTNLSVHFKSGLENSLIWVTRLNSGIPVEGAEVEVRDCRGEILWEGRTNASGFIISDQIPRPGEATHCSWEQMDQGLFVVARLLDDFTFVHSDWDEGIEPWRFQVPVEYDSTLKTLHTVLDRTLVRAGETVHMKHFLRRRSIRGLEAVAGTALPTTLVLTHQGTWDEYTEPIDWPESVHSLETRWTIPRDAKLGTYRISLRDSEGLDLGGGTFRVEEFRVPLMRARMDPPEEPMVSPDRVPLDLSVEYLAGGPAKLLPVSLRFRVLQGGVTTFADFEGFDFGTGRVEVGRFRSDFQESSSAGDYDRLDLQLDEDGGMRAFLEPIPDIESYAVLQAELEFRDPNGEVQTVGTRSSLWPASYLVGIRAESWSSSREAWEFEIAVVDQQAEPVIQQPVRAVLYSQNILSHRKRLVGGFYAYENYREVEEVGPLCEGLTGDDGVLRCRVESPVSGNVIVQVETTDPAGRQSTATKEFWLAGEEEWWFEPEDHDRIDLVSLKEQYEPGEKAEIQVRMPFREATALVAVEREGILRAFTTSLQGTNPVVEVPIERTDVPNVYVSVLVVRGRVGDVPPTAIVDLAKPAYKMGITNLKVGRESYQLQVRVATDRSAYQVRERARVEVAAETSEGVPAAGAELVLLAVDEGLLELAPNPTWEVLDHLLGTRGYGVRTATAQMHVVGKRHFGLKALPHGGGGGKQATRELFDTLLFWDAHLQLDDEGRAQVEIPINDSLTSFRVVAVASLGVDRLGTGETSFRTTQDLMLFSGISPVARQGDRYLAEVTARNASEREMQLRLQLESPDLGRTFAPHRTSLSPGEAETVKWEVPVSVESDLIRFSISGWEGETRLDGLTVEQRVFPVYPVRTVQATLTHLVGPQEIPVERPADAEPQRGGVRIDLQETLLSGLSTVEDYLRSYPYSCLEQVLSQAIVLDEEAAWNRRMAVLAPYLDQDGLLRFFPGTDLGSDVLTSYVLALADARGWQVPESFRESMLLGLEQFVSGSIERRSDLPTADLTVRRVRALDALARYGRAQRSQMAPLQSTLALWPTSALIDWLNILAHLEEFPERDIEVERVQQLLLARLDFQGTLTRFSTEGEDDLWWLMISPDGNLGRLTTVLMEHGFLADQVPRLLRGLLARQRRGHWDLTTANAWGAVAVRTFSERFEAEEVTGETSLNLGAQVLRLDWNEGDAPAAVDLSWPGEATPLRAVHRGGGAPWMQVSARAALPARAMASGYRIRKTIEAVEQKDSRYWSVGDVIRVRLEVDASADMTWVVVEDPIPAGSVILGTGLGRDSALLTEESADAEWWTPTFEERSFRSYRAYYRYLPGGSRVLQYTLRLNQAGRFRLPSTRVEAMYEPEVYGQRPNDDLEIR